ncbi:hypothetical protein, partial [Escherichia phage Lambda_ev058]
SLIHISEPTRLRRISYAVFCLKKKKSYHTIDLTIIIKPSYLNPILSLLHISVVRSGSTAA